MATDLWNGNGDWTGTPADWSLGSAPTSSTDAIIQTGTNTLSTTGTARTLTNQSYLVLSNSAALTTAYAFNNVGYLYLTNNGNTVSVGSVFNNSGNATIGNGSLTTSTTFTAAGLYNNGSITVQGNTTANSTKQATLNITGATSSTVVGNLYVLGDADVALANGLTAIAGGATLELDGAQARVSQGTGTTNSALTGLTNNAGTLRFRGGSGYGAGGSSLTTTTDFSNTGTLSIDQYGSDGGSTIKFGGVLTNTNYAYIGNTSLSASTTVTATGLNNTGSLYVQGNAAAGSNKQTLLNITGATGGAITGNTVISGNADLALGVGLTTISSGATLELDGAQARVSVGTGTTNSALNTLDTISGTLLLRGNSGNGAGAVSVTTSSDLTNTGYLNVDYYGSDGGSSLNVGGRLSNSGTVNIGNTSLSNTTTVTAAGLNSTGTINLQGNTTAASTSRAILKVTQPVSATLVGTTSVAGYADLQLTNGFSAIGGGARLDLYGSRAVISVGSGTTNSALNTLTSNAGNFYLHGNSGYGSGGVNVSIASAFTNSSNLYVDYYGSEGASTLNIAGKFTNTGSLYIGNGNLSSSTNVTADSLSNLGSLTLQGNTTSGTANQATLTVTGSISSTLSGQVRIAGDADLVLPGPITAVGYASSLEIDGVQARVSTGAGASNSALSTLTSNAGSLILRGNSGYGSGGVVINTSKSFTNSGTFSVDYYGSDGASQFTATGNLSNTGTVVIGNGSLSASTTVTASGFSNTGSLVLQGNTASSTSSQATLSITGTTAATATGSTIIRGDANLALTSGLAAIGAGAFFEVDGANARASVASDRSSNSALSGLYINDGTLLLRGNSNYGAGGDTVTTTKYLRNTGAFHIDYYGGNGGSTVTLGGNLINSGDTTIGNSYLGTSTSVTATGLSNTGSLTLQGNTTSGTTNQVTLNITGTTSSQFTGSTRLGGDSDLILTSGIGSLLSGAYFELDGAAARASVGAGSTNSAFSNFTSNAGRILLRGNTGYGAGGVTFTTTKSFNNSGLLQVDYYGGDGASQVTFGGVLTNSGTIQIGNYADSTPTTLTATALTNNGNIALSGSASNLVEIVTSSTTRNSGTLNIGANTELNVTNSAQFQQLAGTTTVSGLLAASSISVSGGLLDFASALTPGNGTGNMTLKTGGVLEFDAAVDTSHTVTFSGTSAGTLKLTSPGTFAGKISGFTGSDVIDLANQQATGLSYSGNATSGTLTVTGASGTIATLSFLGNYTTASFNLVSDGHGGTEILDPPTDPNAKDAPSRTMYFTGDNDVLLIKNAATISTLVEGFGAGRNIDLADFASAGDLLTYKANSANSGGLLSLQHGSEAVNVALDGQFLQSAFHLSADASGAGTSVTYTPPAQVANLAVAHA